MIKIVEGIASRDLRDRIERLFDLSAGKITALHRRWNTNDGAPVFTRAGIYSTRGWTEWTLGFQFGMQLLQYDFTNDRSFLDIGRKNIFRWMPTYLTNSGTHDHGFNIISTYGNLLRLSREEKPGTNSGDLELCELALKVSGAVQAMRWTELGNGLGYIYSFNGRHSLYADTIRSLRSLAVAHSLGHVLIGEHDERISLLRRLLQHAETTARYNVYLGENRDSFDVPGRVTHEAIFDVLSGAFRCASTQQGYSPFSTWTRGLSWIICGFAEELEYVCSLPEEQFGEALGLQELFIGKKEVLERFEQVAEAVADFYITNTPTDGIPYWDTGAPGLSMLGDYLNKPADPFNDHEPVDSSAAVIAAQGLIRLGNFLSGQGKADAGSKYILAGLTVARRVFSEPYLSTDQRHEGLILHSVYHRPNGWDYIPSGRKIPLGESSMWGDFHAMELGLLIYRMAEGKKYPAFFNI